MSGDGGGKPSPIAGTEVRSWFERFSRPHPCDADCAELALMMTKLAWPDPPDWGIAGSATLWNFDGVPKAAQVLLANLPVMLSPFAAPAVQPGDREGHAALVNLHAALNRAMPYLSNPYERTNNGHRLRSWHVPSAVLFGPIFGALVRAGHPKPGITRNSIVAGVLSIALQRMGHGAIETGAIGQHLSRWLAASGMTTNDIIARVTMTGVKSCE